MRYRKTREREMWNIEKSGMDRKYEMIGPGHVLLDDLCDKGEEGEILS